MPGRHRTGRKVAGFLVVAVLVTGSRGGDQVHGVWGGGRSGARRQRSHRLRPINENSPLADLNKALANGDARAITIIEALATPSPKVPQTAYTDGEAEEWINTLTALRANYRKLTVPDRVSAITAACRIFDRFASGAGAWLAGSRPSSRFTTCSLPA